MITIVSGLPRSGTSLMMQMLSRGGLPLITDATRSPDANNPHGYCEYAPVKRLAQDTSWLPEADGKAVKVIAPLLPYLPEGHTYKVILMQRDMREVLASQQRMLERLGRPGGAPDVLARAFEQHLARARQWARQPHVEVLDVVHARLLIDAKNISMAVAAFLGEPLDVEAMATAVDPSLYRERQALHDADLAVTTNASL